MKSVNNNKIINIVRSSKQRQGFYLIVVSTKNILLKEKIHIKIKKFKKNSLLNFSFGVFLNSEEVSAMNDALRTIFSDIKSSHFLKNLSVQNDSCKIFVYKEDEIDAIEQVLNIKYSCNYTIEEIYKQKMS